MTISNLTLYKLTDDYIRAIEGMLESNEEGSDLGLEIIKDNFEEKCLNVGRYIKNLEGEYAAIKAEADRMAARAKSVSNHIDRLTEYLRSNIEKSGLLDPIKSPEFDIKLAKNPPSLVIFDADLIPDIYKEVQEVIKINNAALKADIKDGFEIEGCKLEQKTRLVIK